MRRRGFLTGLAAVTAVGPSAIAQGDVALAPLARDFITMMVESHGFDRAVLETSFGRLRVNAKVIELLTPPAAGGRQVWWDEYRARHLDWLNVGKGVRFAQRHSATLAQAEEAYGVPGPILTAILGVETRYGTYTGTFTTLESLATLAFAYPPRADYFRGELEQLLLYARDQGLDLGDLEGSYAGALGYPQFMPTSARTWAVDMDGDGRANLFSFADAIGSVGNFLREHGWQHGVPVAFAVTVAAKARPQDLLAAGIEPSLTVADFAAAGLPVTFPAGEPPYAGALALIDLVNQAAVEYRAGTGNYYALTRYNRSNKYAMTVLDLAREIAARRQN